MRLSRSLRFATTAAILFLAVTATACGSGSSSSPSTTMPLEVSNAWALRALDGHAEVFMTVESPDDSALVAARVIEYPQAIAVFKDGAGHLERVELPARSEVALQPGGQFVSITDLPADFAARGFTVEVSFADGSSFSVAPVVRQG